MSIEFILGIFFVMVIVAFIGGMVMLPQLFGISKPEESIKQKAEEEKKVEIYENAVREK